MYFSTIGIHSQHALFIIVLIMVSAGTEASGFSFTNPPKCINTSSVKLKKVPKNQDLVLDCSTTDSSSTSILYFKQRGIYTSKLNYTSNGSIYTIPKSNLPKTPTEYKCVATNTSGHNISWSCLMFFVHLNLEAAFVNTAQCSHVTGKSFDITCRVTFKGYDAHAIKIELYTGINNSFTKVPDKRLVPPKYLQRRTTKLQAIEVKMSFKQAQVMPSTLYRCTASTSQYDQLVTKNSKIITVVVKDPIPAKIVNFPISNPLILKPSQRISLYCSAKGFPMPVNYKWFKDGKEINQCFGGPSCVDYRWSSEDCDCQKDRCLSALTILSARYNFDKGTYSCMATNSYGLPDTRTINVFISAAPKIDKSSTKVVQVTNKPKNISCRTTQGYPLATFKWMYAPMVCTATTEDCKPANKWLPIGSNHVQRPSMNTPTSVSTITIPASMVRSFYKCTANNNIGHDSHEFKFLRSKRYNPSVAIKSLNTFSAGETLNISCIVSDGTFSRWFKDGRKVYPSRDPRMVMKRQKSHPVETVILTIKNLTTVDSGLYECKARDYDRSPMKHSKFIRVKALFAPNITSLPNITAFAYPHNETTVQVTCHVTANPKPRITWSRMGDSLAPLERVENCDNSLKGYYLKKTSDGSGNTLVICDADYSHSGPYTCLAENSKGSESKTAFLDVLTPPAIKNDKAYKLLYKSTGESVEIQCKATGNPKPKVVWTKTSADGSTIMVQGKQGTVDSATLNITKLREADFGNYTCIATNSRGSDRLVLQIRDLSENTLPQFDKKIIIIVASACGAAGFVLLVAIVACLIVGRRNKRLIEEYKAIKYLRKGEDYKIDPDRTLLEQCEDLPYDVDWEFPVKRLEFHGVIGSGSFGQIIKAEAVGILSFTARDKTSDAFRRRTRLRRRLSSSRLYQDSAGRDYSKTTVAVKTLKADAKESDYKDLATELKIMIHLGEHANIINLLGACTRGKQLMVIMEFAPHGNLLNFLRSRREVYEPTWRKTANNPEVEFTLADLVMFSYQIARGMDFLSSKKCVHRDLAARNILVGDDYVMKIADFGLARDIYKTDVYIKETTGLLPIKWMAPESLFDRMYTQKTDVWSFGVVLWESQTLGGTPYPGVPIEELMDYLSEGKRMRQPRNCPPEIYAIMRDCWSQSPVERPTFSELVRRIERILEKKISGQENDSPYISVFMDEDLHRIYYMEPKDASSEAKPASSPSLDPTRVRSMTEEEIQSSPLPPIPFHLLENIHELPDNNPYYYDPVDSHPTKSRYVISPTSPTKSLPRGEKNSKFNSYQSEHRNSGASTGMESGIELDEASFREHSLERRGANKCNGYNQTSRLREPVDASGISLLDPSVVKDKTKETML